MDTRELENLSLQLAESHGMSQEEAASLITTMEKVTDTFVEAFEYAFKVVSMILEGVSALTVLAAESLHESEKQNWIIDWDTRKKSLVVSNRPRFMVRKIIR